MSAMRLPDFIIAGAPRSGTTWLWRLAGLHPAIVMAKPVRPEPKFFLVDDLYAKGLDWYSATWFAGIPPEQVAGEKSANYMESANSKSLASQLRFTAAVHLIIVTEYGPVRSIRPS